ncbi:hypothetical protein AAY473_017995 [Plecturocebus cupreus]
MSVARFPSSPLSAWHLGRLPQRVLCSPVDTQGLGGSSTDSHPRPHAPERRSSSEPSHSPHGAPGFPQTLQDRAGAVTSGAQPHTSSREVATEPLCLPAPPPHTPPTGLQQQLQAAWHQHPLPIQIVSLAPRPHSAVPAGAASNTHTPGFAPVAQFRLLTKYFSNREAAGIFLVGGPELGAIPLGLLQGGPTPRGGQVLCCPRPPRRQDWCYYCPCVPDDMSWEQSQRPLPPQSATPVEDHSLARGIPRGASPSSAVHTSGNRTFCETQFDPEMDGQLVGGLSPGPGGRSGFKSQGKRGQGPHQATGMLSSSDPTWPLGVPSCPVLSSGGQGDRALSRRPSCALGHLSSRERVLFFPELEIGRRKCCRHMELLGVGCANREDSTAVMEATHYVVRAPQFTLESSPAPELGSYLLFIIYLFIGWARWLMPITSELWEAEEGR